MVFYEVSLTVRPELCAQLLSYMRYKHIPEIWATACFNQIHFAQASDYVFRTCYQAQTMADYERYVERFASAMRADFMNHFPEGCEVNRQVWSGVQSWEI